MREDTKTVIKQTAVYLVEVPAERTLVGRYSTYLKAEEACRQVEERYGLHAIIICDRGMPVRRWLKAASM